MAQNDPQGMEAASRTGTSPAQDSEPSRAPTGTSPTTATTTGREQEATGPEQGQSGRRLSRREGWEDPIGAFFGGSPFALFRRLSDDMDRLFFGGGQHLGTFGGMGRFVPNIDVEEREDRILVRADLPGVRPEDFRVDIEDDALVLQGERRSEREESRGGVRRVERSHGSFRRVIPLPQGAKLEGAEARFENGVLEIDVPFQQQSRSRRLEVRSGGGTEKTSAASSGTTSSDPLRH